MTAQQLLYNLQSSAPFYWYARGESGEYFSGIFKYTYAIRSIEGFPEYIVFDRNENIVKEKDSFRVLAWKAAQADLTT